MPPKLQPRRRQPARSSRGGAHVNELTPAVNAPSPKEPLVIDDDETQSASMENDLANLPKAQLADPGPLPDPAAAPSTTAASQPPSRRSVQRLASVLPRSSSYAASNSIPADGSDARPPSLKFKPKSNARRSKEEREAFERAEAERLAARQAADGASFTADRGGYYGRGRGRGFGDMNRWKNERFNLSHEASGHLGGATIPEGAPRRGRGGWGGNGGGHGSGGLGGGGASGPHPEASNTRVKNEPHVKPEKDKDGDILMTVSGSASKLKRAKVKRETQGANYVSSEGELDSDGGRKKKKNIERINLISSDEEEQEEHSIQSEVAKGKQRERTPHIPNTFLRPVRIQRQEHVERSVGVNTDASSLTSAELRRRAKDRQDAGGSLFLSEDETEILPTFKAKARRKPKDVEFVRDERRWKGVYQDEDAKDANIKIKDEPKDDDDAMVVDTPIINERPDHIPADGEDSGVPLSTAIQVPASKAREITKITETLDELGEATGDETAPQPEETRSWPRGYVGSENLYSTEENEKFLAELEAILAVLSDFHEGISSTKPAPSTKFRNDDGDVHMDQELEAVFLDDEECKHGYIFQLPPIIPSLRNASKKAISPKLERKQNLKTSIGPPVAAASNNPFNVHSRDGPAIKADPDGITSKTAHPNAYLAGDLYIPSGQAGLLNIHSKGSMRLYWGGTSLEISKGESGGLIPQEMVITSITGGLTKVEDERRWEDRMDVGEKGWTMGQTQKGFVCIPEWSSLLP